MQESMLDERARTLRAHEDRLGILLAKLQMKKATQVGETVYISNITNKDEFWCDCR